MGQVAQADLAAQVRHVDQVAWAREVRQVADASLAVLSGAYRILINSISNTSMPYGALSPL
jgi:hypothetical protein